MKFNRLAVICVDEDSIFKSDNVKQFPCNLKYLCECSCGKLKSTRRRSLLDGRTKSCGCLWKESNHLINRVEYYEDFVKIFFSNCDSFTTVDTDDYLKVKDYGWSRVSTNTNGLYYAKARIRGKAVDSRVSLHQLLMPTEEGFVPDHIDGDGLNNRRHNLRIVTNSQNGMNTSLFSNNTSGTKGVYWHNRSSKWKAQINVDNRRINLGTFQCKRDAITRRRLAEVEYFGEYSYYRRNDD